VILWIAGTWRSLQMADSVASHEREWTMVITNSRHD